MVTRLCPVQNVGGERWYAPFLPCAAVQIITLMMRFQGRSGSISRGESRHSLSLSESESTAKESAKWTNRPKQSKRFVNGREMRLNYTAGGRYSQEQ